MERPSVAGDLRVHLGRRRGEDDGRGERPVRHEEREVQVRGAVHDEGVSDVMIARWMDGWIGWMDGER